MSLVEVLLREINLAKPGILENPAPPIEIDLFNENGERIGVARLTTNSRKEDAKA